MAQRQDIANHADAHVPGTHYDRGGGDITRGLDIDCGEVMLIHERAGEAELFAQRPFVEMLLISPGDRERIAEPISETDFRTRLAGTAG